MGNDDINMNSNELELKDGESASSLILNTQAFDQIERLANLMASGKSTIPDHLKTPGDCMAIIMQSMQWRMNPWSVAQKTFLVSGKMGYESQLVAAVINSSGLIKGRFKFDFYGEWEKIIGKFEIKSGNNGEYRVPGWRLEDEAGIGVRVSAQLRDESEPRVLDLLLAQARTRNSTLWADDPKQQLAYLGQKKWARLYAPDVIMGVYSIDELQDHKVIDMGDAEVIPENAVEDEPEALPEYPDEEFKKNKSKWVDLIDSGKSVESIINTVQSKYTMTEEQKTELREFS